MTENSSKRISEVYQSGLKLGDVLSPLCFKSALEYAIKKVHENQERFELNGKHRFLVYTDDVNILDENINTTKKGSETLLQASNEMVSYVVMSSHQNAGQSHIND
jgi:hypothetical protein